MSGPLDDDERENPNARSSDEFGEDSLTWGAADPDFDRLLRDRIGPVAPMPTPPFAFERVLMAGRRRRARKLWTGAAAAAFVVMAGTAGATVALNSGHSTGLATAGTGPSSSSLLPSPAASSTPSATTGPSASSTPSASPSASASSGSASPSGTPAVTPQCHSVDLNPSATVQAGSDGTSATLLLVLTNTSGHPCTTFGYPGLEFEPAGGSPLQPVTEARVEENLKAEVTVPPNGTVSSLVTYQTTASSATLPPGCYPPSAYVLVIPPNEQAQAMGTIKNGPITICGNGAVSLSPLVPGSTGS
jgi:hypothetical protein